MSSLVRDEDDGAQLDSALRELEQSISLYVPSDSTLRRAVDELSRGLELTSDELNTVLRNVERVWHMARLMRLLSEFFGDALFFGGGAVLNYIYMVRAREVPRFTFDLDTAWRKPATAKREVLKHIPLFNRWLAEKGYALKLPVGAGRYTYLWVVEYDVEKDHFPNILSLRVPVLTRYTGEPFYRYLSIRDYSTISRLRTFFARTLGVRDLLVDYVRFEISLGMHDVPVTRLETADVFGNRVSMYVTEPELQLAWKITGKIGRRLRQEDLHDLLKAALDLRLLRYFSTERVREYVLGEVRPDVVAESARLNLELLKTQGRKYWSSHHYVLVRKTVELERLADSLYTTILQLLLS